MDPEMPQAQREAVIAARIRNERAAARAGSSRVAPRESIPEPPLEIDLKTIEIPVITINMVTIKIVRVSHAIISIGRFLYLL